MTSQDSNIRIPIRKDYDTGISDNDERRVAPVTPKRDFGKILDDEKESKGTIAKKQAKAKSKPFTTDKDLLGEEVDVEKVPVDAEGNPIVEGEVDENPFIPKVPLKPKSLLVKGDDKPKESPFLLYKQSTATKSNPQPLAWQADGDTDLAAPWSKDKVKGAKVAGSYQEASSDIATVNPLAQVGVPVANVGDAPVTPEVTGSTLPSDLQIVVEKLIKELYVVEQSGKTDTIVVLQQPPLFKDAQIVVTSFNTATKEFNLSFENLTPQAKQLLDNNLPALRIDLESKGFANAVHIITTTTQIEHNVFTGSEDERGGRGGGGGGSQEEDEQEGRRR